MYKLNIVQPRVKCRVNLVTVVGRVYHGGSVYEFHYPRSLGVLEMEVLFVCVEVLWPSQPNGVISSAVSLPNHTFTGQA